MSTATPSTLGRLAGLLAYAPFLPISSVRSAMRGDDGSQIAEMASADLGRGTGATFGMAVLPKLLSGNTPMSPVGRLASLLAAGTLGGYAGHATGQSLGRSIFNKQGNMKKLNPSVSLDIVLTTVKQAAANAPKPMTPAELFEGAKLASSLLEAVGLQKKEPRSGFTHAGMGAGAMAGAGIGLGIGAGEGSTVGRMANMWPLKSLRKTIGSRLPLGVGTILSGLLLGGGLGAGVGGAAGKGIDMIRDRMN